jgi:16S rRNA (guanine527-N7)-methyltransferase
MMASITASDIEQTFKRAGITVFNQVSYDRMAAYAELLERWNARLNLTALRSSEEILRRHLLECAFAANKLPEDIDTLMDYGSGAGFPGMIIAICRPEIAVTLAEAQGRKASFLREVVRTLGIPAEVYEGRVEQMPEQQQFHAVTMRAVEKTEQAIPMALRHLQRYLVLLTTINLVDLYRVSFTELLWHPDIPIPTFEQSVLAIAVPRGTIRA